MARTFTLEIVTPEKIVFSEEVTSVVFPAHEGYYGVLAGHAPLLANLRPGEISIRREKGEVHYATSGGFVEATPKRCIVLCESAEDVAAIDVERAKESLQRATDRLKSTEKGVDRERAEAAKERAANRLRLGQKYRK